jgi:hypothetical protein
MKQKVASCLNLENTKRITILHWMCTLPIEFRTKTMMKVLHKCKGKRYIIWREGLGFRVYK